MKLPYSCTFYEVTNEHVIHMFNEIGHQHVLTGISLFWKSSLPCVLNFLFGIILRCLIGRSSGLDKAKLEVYAMFVGLYYNLNVDYVTQI